MNTEKNLEWFKEAIAPNLKNYKIEYRFYKEGDFGSLNQVSFDSIEIGGEIDFWGMGWLSINLWDYLKDESMLNVFLEPKQHLEKEEAFKKLQKLLNL